MLKREKNEKSKINVHDMYIAASVSFEVGSLYVRHTYPVSMQTFFNQVIKREKRIGGDISSNDVEIVISRNLLPFHLQRTIRMGKSLPYANRWMIIDRTAWITFFSYYADKNEILSKYPFPGIVSTHCR